ncbi:MAG: Septum formation initiator [Actinomycetota bacterium]|nr:Septum formation initiator [Actinomycetota bacterium]
MTPRRKRKLGRWGRAPQIVAGVLILGLLGAMAIKPTKDLLQQKSRVAGVAQELAVLQKSNGRLEHRIAKLKDPDYIDQLARRQIGLVKPGEVPYVVMPPSRRVQKRAHHKAASRPARPPVESPSFVQKVLHFIGIG